MGSMMIYSVNSRYWCGAWLYGLGCQAMVTNRGF